MDRPIPLIVCVHRYILSHLDRGDLCPRDIATANGISVRQLHRLFSGTGTTVSEWVRRLRLARCAADLRHPASVAEGITAIAFRWGFNDSAHFSKAFRAEFGQSPRAYRAQHAGLVARRPQPDRLLSGTVAATVPACAAP